MSTLFRRADRRANLKIFMLAGFVGSELMWIIRTDNKRADFERQTSAQIRVTRNIIDRINSGEKVDVERELLSGVDRTARPGDDGQQSVSAILQNLEAMDAQWSQQANTIPLKSAPKPAEAAENGPKKGSGFL